VSFVVTAKNNGPDTGTNIVIDEAIPSGFSVTPSAGTTYSNGVWTISSLAYLATATLNITGTGVPQSTVTNTVTRINQTEYNNQPTTISKTVYIPQVNLYAENYPWWWNSDTQTSQYEYVVGNVPAITLDIWNLGPDDATGVTYTYTIGKGLQYVGNSADAGTVTYANNQLTWNIGNISSGGDIMMKIFVRIIESGTQTPDLTTTANLTHVDQYYTPSTHNNATCQLTAPLGVDIAVNQTQNTYTDTQGNQYVTYTITATNNGPDNATGVQINDQLPTGLTYTTSTPPTGTTYTNTNGLWNIGNMNNGETETLTITALITQTTGTITNTATLTNTNEYDWNFANNAQTTIITMN
jgi:uncharacterized repeat protein (TIGR01451 family)